MITVRWMNNPLYVACDWLVKLAYMHFLWVIFTALGGFVAGLFPATVALHTLVGRLARGESTYEILPTFFAIWKQEFIRSNKYALVFFLAFGLFFVNFNIMTVFPDELLFFMMTGMGISVFFFAIIVSFFFPVYVSRPDLSFFKMIALSLFLPFRHMKSMLIFLGGILLLLALYYFLPMLGFFWGISLLACITTLITTKELTPIK
ncbi:DUF624 domain-containing protein [Paenalkalicoccus suaedae]|uniref:DUF624 domain-containing protein n=1 Tax=Paenalkalicoccus suaedae TaxID=2592382 RepID=A0A859FJI8_9BACI|nr:DUF624 domain-containing protein [Paenalkalicoccus suaedae]QKS72973.1 DUF624 domain-containing protein [Paenalkalicoccus suaedae]